MLFNKIYFNFILVCHAIAGVQMVKGLRDDLFFPNERLKKIKGRKIMVGFFVLFVTLLFFFVFVNCCFRYSKAGK